MEDVLGGLNLVPIAAWKGKGARAGLWTPFLMAIYNEETKEYQTICKIGVGFQEEVLSELADGLQSFVVASKPSNYVVSDDIVPDIWLEPAKVWEVIGADLSLSPVHTAARDLCGVESKGISLRFPRFVKSHEEKSTNLVTKSSELVSLWMNQRRLVGDPTLSQ